MKRIGHTPIYEWRSAIGESGKRYNFRQCVCTTCRKYRAEQTELFTEALHNGNSQNPEERAAQLEALQPRQP